MNQIVTPLVSVVIPSYNHAQYLGRALQSVIDQTYNNWEIIVVDNHSTDNTDKVIEYYSDPRIRYFKIQNNGIIAISRNIAIKAALGEWIAFLDSDDWWRPDKLKVCIENINKGVDIIHHDLGIISNKYNFLKRRLIKSRQLKLPITLDLIVNGNALATSSVMVKRKLLIQVSGMSENPALVAAEDYNTWLRISQLSDGFKYIPELLGFYQIHNMGTSSSKDMSIPKTFAIADFVHLLSKQQMYKVNAELNYTRGRFYYLSDNCIEASKYLRGSLKYSNISIKFKAVVMLIILALIR